MHICTAFIVFPNSPVQNNISVITFLIQQFPRETVDEDWDTDEQKACKMKGCFQPTDE